MSLIDGLRKIIPIHSLIKTNYEHLFSIDSLDCFYAYIACLQDSFGFQNNRNMSPITASFVIVSFPLMYFVFSTNFVKEQSSRGKSVCLPLFIWALLDKYFIRVNRQNVGNSPGLIGEIHCTMSDSICFHGFCQHLFTDEFLCKLLFGTPFQSLVKTRVDKDGNKVYHVDSSLKDAINARLLSFKGIPFYSLEFLEAVDSFFSAINGCFYRSIPMVTRMPRRSDTDEAGMHCFRNAGMAGCFIFHKSLEQMFRNQIFENSFIILAKLFNFTYFISLKGNFSEISPCTEGLEKNELIIDLDIITYNDIFRTLFSVSLKIIEAERAQGNEKVGLSKVLDISFGGVRHYTTVSSASIRKWRANATGESVYFARPIPCRLIRIYDFGGGNVVVTENPS